MISVDYIKENADLLNKLSLLKDEKHRSRFINHLLIDGNTGKVSLTCKYDNGNHVHLTPNSINRFEDEDLNIDLDKLQAELLTYTKNFIKKEAEEKILKVKSKLINNGVEIQ